MASQQKNYVSKEEKKVIAEFLKAYKEHRCLWDMNHDMYTNKDERNSAYNILLEILKKTYPNATITFLKKKIENMRCAYKREARKVRESESAGSDPVYRSRLWYYKDMAFLEQNDVFRRRKNMWDAKEKENNNDAVESLDTSVEDDPSPLPPQKECSQDLEIKKESFIQTPLQSGVETPHVSLPSTPHVSLPSTPHASLSSTPHGLLSAVDEWQIIGKSIGLQLRQLNGSQQDIANKLIAEIIFYGKRNKLTDSSSISLCADPLQT